jgi:hypothetical protein
MGADIGNKASISQGQQANALLQGGMAGSRAMLDAGTGAAQYNLAGNLATAGGIMQAGKTIGGMFTQQPQQPVSTPFSSYWNYGGSSSDPTQPTNPMRGF